MIDSSLSSIVASMGAAPLRLDDGFLSRITGVDDPSAVPLLGYYSLNGRQGELPLGGIFLLQYNNVQVEQTRYFLRNILCEKFSYNIAESFHKDYFWYTELRLLLFHRQSRFSQFSLLHI
jgi:hypothetical protein